MNYDSDGQRAMGHGDKNTNGRTDGQTDRVVLVELLAMMTLYCRWLLMEIVMAMQMLMMMMMTMAWLVVGWLNYVELAWTGLGWNG